MAKTESEKKVEDFYSSHNYDPALVDLTDKSGFENLYSMNDVISGIFNPPFVAKNDNVAIRLVKDTLLRESSTVTSHPEDFKLFCLGIFNKSTGDVVGNEIKHVCNIVDLVPRVQRISDTFNTTPQTSTGMSEN